MLSDTGAELARIFFWLCVVVSLSLMIVALALNAFIPDGIGFTVVDVIKAAIIDATQ